MTKKQMIKENVVERNRVIGKLIQVLFFVLAFIFNCYFVALNVAEKASVPGCFYGFKVVWFFLGLFFCWSGVFWKQHIWKRLYEKISAKNEMAAKGILYTLAGLAVFFVFSTGCILHYIISHGKSDFSGGLIDDNQNKTVMIVHGGGLNGDGSLPPAVVNKLEKAAEVVLNEKYPNFLLIMAGGQLPLTISDEASVMKEYFDMLLPAEAFGTVVLEENRSMDTIENLQNATAIAADYLGVSLSELKNKEIVLVTSESHLARTKLIARRMGFSKVKGVASKTPLLYVPNNYAREVFAYFKLAGRILFTGKPNEN